MDRTSRDEAEVRQKFPKIDEWIKGISEPSMTKLKELASFTYTPLTYFYFNEPLDETLPISDFRTPDIKRIKRGSADIVDLFTECVMRQDWVIEYYEDIEQDELDWVGSESIDSPYKEAAARIANVIPFPVEERKGDYSAIRKELIERIEDAGIFVNLSGYVELNTRRKVDPDMLRGFALSSKLAPFIYVNGADHIAAQIFTFMHEVAHIFLGDSGLDNVMYGKTTLKKEIWCNEVAAEYLVPESVLVNLIHNVEVGLPKVKELSHKFGVSKSVIIYRLNNLEVVSDSKMRVILKELIGDEGSFDPQKPSGGNFYNTYPLKVSRKFLETLFEDTFRGETRFFEALKVLGIRRDTFRNLAKQFDYY